MILIVRDEDVPTVSAAVTKVAAERGLVPSDGADAGANALASLLGGGALASMLGGPQVVVAMAGDQVTVTGLPSLGIAESDEWGKTLSRECAAEVVVVDVREDGVRVTVFDDGDVDESIDVPLDRSGRTCSPELAELAATEESEAAFRDGVEAEDAAELAEHVLEALDALPSEDEDEGDVATLVFEDPSESNASDAKPALVVDTVSAAGLVGKLNAGVAPESGNVFSVRVEGVSSVEGVRLELSGSGLELTTIDTVHLWARVRGQDGSAHHVLKPGTPDGETRDVIVIELPDAFLESVQVNPLAMDPMDLMGSVQRFQEQTDRRAMNTILLQPSGKGRKRGEGKLTLRASSLDGSLASDAATVPVRVR